MKGKLLFFCFLVLICFFSLDVTGQYVQGGTTVQMNGRILDADTNQAIAFANIGFIDRGIGTVSDDQGFFELQFRSNQVGSEAIFQVSMIGYTTRQFTHSQIKSILNNKQPIRLSPTRYSLETVALNGVRYRSKTIGNSKLEAYRFGYWKNQNGLGGEIATSIKIRDKGTRLDALKVKVVENISDSLLIRVNIYDIDPTYFTPAQKIVTQPIVHTISIKEGTAYIPLKEYGIIVDDDIIVSVELLKVYGKDIGLVLACSSNKRSSFIKKNSQDAWEIRKGEAMAFTLDISYPDKNQDAIVKRVVPQQVHIWWDASAKNGMRNLKDELELLQRYLKSIRKAEVIVHRFATAYADQRSFDLSRGRADAIVKYLQTTHYDGDSDFSVLASVTSDRQKVHLLFSDGHSVFSTLRPVFNATTFAISSFPSPEYDTLEDLALFTDGALIDLKKQSVKEGFSLLLKDIPASELNTPELVSAATIEGLVTAEIEINRGVLVENKRSGQRTRSDSDGKFEIEAKAGDLIELRYPGYLTARFKVGNKSSYAIEMATEGDWLNEVVLETKVKKEQKVVTELGRKNFDAITTKQNVITYKDIKPHHIRLEDVLAREPQLLIQRHPYTGEVVYSFPRTRYMSAFRQLLPIVVLDGIIYEQTPLESDRPSNSMPAIDIQNISSIVITSSLSATTLYGNIASGGAIIIKTKSFDLDYNNPGQRINRDTLLVQNNNYDESLRTFEEARVIPGYLKQLEQASTYAQALDIYQNFRAGARGEELSFLLHSAQYFRKWNPKKAQNILMTISALYPKNIEVLKTLGYQLDRFGMTQERVALATHLISLAPNEIQFYRDLALAYQDNGQYQEAFSIYKQLLNNQIKGLDFEPLKETLENELLHLLAFHKSKVRYQDLPNELLDVRFKKDRRLVFEWVDPAMAFEIQFVNPNAKYFKWTHTKWEQLARIQEEYSKGYTLQEFALDEAPPGEWLINIESLEIEKTTTPKYLKYTIYEQYATPNQTKTVKIIDLNEQSQKVTLGKITLN
ncbi:MAG: carboxypeptidase-like regulatory domain-containing protein [Dokdonia sp.]